MNDFQHFREALTFAIKKYNGLNRKTENIPYFIHPIRICTILRAAGYNEFKNPELMIAALLHDLIEDTSTTKNEIIAKFGEKVANIVVDLSKKQKEKKDVYLKSLEYASKEARIIKMADRIDNLLDMNISGWNKQKKMKYAKHGQLILRICGSSDKKLSKKLSEVIIEVLEDLQKN